MDSGGTHHGLKEAFGLWASSTVPLPCCHWARDDKRSDGPCRLGELMQLLLLKLLPSALRLLILFNDMLYAPAHRILAKFMKNGKSKNSDISGEQIVWSSLKDVIRLTGCPGSHCWGVRMFVMKKVKRARGCAWIQYNALTLKACFITRLCMPTFTSTTIALCTPSAETSMLAMSIPLSSCTLFELKLQCQVTSAAAKSCIH